MTAVEISVRGAHTVMLPPQQARVYANLTADGPDAQPVFDAVAAALTEVVGSLETRHHPDTGPVTAYAVDQVRRSSYRPYDADGRRLAVVHTAAVSITATFTDFDALAGWVGWSAGVPGLAVNHIEWSLTETERLRVQRATRQEAVRDAARRAQDYADAVDLGQVSVRRISDLGTTGSGPVALARKALTGAAPYDAGGAPQIPLRPEEVEISAEVDALFVAGADR